MTNSPSELDIISEDPREKSPNVVNVFDFGLG